MNNLIIDVKSVKLFAKSKRKTLNILLSLSNKYQRVHPTQQWLANKVGCTSEWISKITTELQSEGWISKLYRHMTSCVYTPSSLLFDFYTRQSLKDILPALAWIPLSVGMLINTELTKSSNDIYRNISYSSFEEKFSEIKMSSVVKKIADKYGMNGYQREQLANYTDSVLEQADRITSKATELENKIGYFFGVCKNKLANPYLFKNNITTKPIIKNVSDNGNRILTDITAKPPSHNAFISEVKTADERKELQLRHQAWKSRRNNYIDGAYGKTVKEIKEMEGYVAIGELLKPYREPLIEAIGEATTEDWWSMQQPMDMDDYYQI